MYDLIIIGAGPAGLSAALTASYLKLNYIVVEANIAGGALVQSYPWKPVDSFIGFKDKKGQEIAKVIVDHVRSEGAIIKERERVESIKMDGKTFIVVTDKGQYETKSVLIATGTIGTPRRLEIKGEENPHVHYSIINPDEYKDKDVIVIGGGDSAVEAAIALHDSGARVKLVHRRDELRATEKNIEDMEKRGIKVLWNCELKEVKGDNTIEEAILYNNRDDRYFALKIDEVFIFIGSVLNLDFIKNIGINMERNRVIVDKDMKTNIDGIYASGDITGTLKRIPQAIGEGHLAVYSIFKYIRNPYWGKT